MMTNSEQLKKLKALVNSGRGDTLEASRLFRRLYHVKAPTRLDMLSLWRRLRILERQRG